MKCTNCSNELEVNAKFCGKCGNKNTHETNEKTVSKKTEKKFLSGVIGFIFLY